MKSRVEKFFIRPTQFLGKVSVQQIWWVLIGVAAAIAVVFTGLAGYRSFQYFRLGSSAQATATEWSVKELGSSQFAVEASFAFEVGGGQFHGKTLFNPPIYLNPFSAQESIKTRGAEPVTVWFQASNPSVCSLQKEFPLKSLLNALLTWGVAVYFVFISKKLLLSGTRSDEPVYKEGVEAAEDNTDFQSIGRG